MSMSIFTNAASMASTNAMNNANKLLTTSMERLGTGKRINSAADDAAGLQIATRLQGQSNGMTVAQRNIADSTAMMQTAEGAFDEVSNIMYRMKDLATQAANDTNTQKDRDAINTELNDLNAELGNIMKNTSYAGEKLFGASGKFGKELSFQIGSSADETMKVDLSAELGGASGASGANTGLIDGSGNFNGLNSSGYASTASGVTTINIKDAAGAKALMEDLEKTLDDVGSVRSKMGASINRLSYAASNLANMQDNTDLALSNVRDANYATEASSMTRNQLLSQTSMSMLKQSNSMSSMVVSLLG
ncbi:lateral flagellin LafA [Enterobacter cloacae complex sp. P15RS]|uniref:flagellin N-terminal helical domain-containing protein n=1 Tax=Enterobacter cloacae complex sp. P15RS TaxID=2779578 RepID=UPI0018666E5E|nr:flagellin [Enterobacter cloacae complex sp. P15RS]MBE3470464.1 lateral flagellin LafA [Enterobacter cloacae complex sp. P15RS]